jgi:dihydrofolate synthase/folylpolyglutamate synthase
MSHAGNPHRQFPAIHIAGTNGKGSTAAFLASAFMAAGYRTGLYSSPHLRRFTERVCVDGKEIPEKVVAEYARELRPAIEQVRGTFFEATTCIAFRYFADREVDVGIIETGLGGRLDATNVVQPLATVISEISIDHTRELGMTVASIAHEKGGIMKRGVPCITSARGPEALHVLSNEAREKSVPLFQSHILAPLKMWGMRGGYAVVDLGVGRLRIRGVRLGLAGYHQAVNAQLATATLEVLLRSSRIRSRFPRLSTDSTALGLRRVVSHTGFSGRLQVLGERRRYLLDVAHNPSGMQTLVRSVPALSAGTRVTVFGVMKDKEYGPMLDLLGRVSSVIVLVAPEMERAADPDGLCRICRSRGISAVVGGSVRGGLARAELLAGAEGTILVTGSHYVVGEALRTLTGKGLDKTGRKVYI